MIKDGYVLLATNFHEYVDSRYLVHDYPPFCSHACTSLARQKRRRRLTLM